MRFFAFLGVLLLAGPLRADPMADIVRFHIAAMGGEDRIAELASLRAKGVVRSGGHELAFEMVAQRPNRIRITTRAEGRTLIQGWDGLAEPWRFEPEKSSEAQRMGPTEARTFAADAEFDDPLIGGDARGYALDYAGEIEWQGRPALRVLVTRPGDPAHTLIVDHRTYFILARVVDWPQPSGATAREVTRFSDFQPVEGVILPFRIEMRVNDQLVQETVLSEVVPAPNPPAGTFARPESQPGR